MSWEYRLDNDVPTSGLKTCPCCGEQVQLDLMGDGYETQWYRIGHDIDDEDDCRISLESWAFDEDAPSKAKKAIMKRLVRRWNTRVSEEAG